MNEGVLKNDLIELINKLTLAISKCELQIDDVNKTIDEIINSIQSEETEIKLEKARKLKIKAEANKEKLEYAFQEVISIMKRINSHSSEEIDDVIKIIIGEIVALDSDTFEKEERIMSSTGEFDSEIKREVKMNKIKKDAYQSVLDAFEGLEIVSNGHGGK